MCYAYTIIFTVMIISECSLGGMTIVNVLMAIVVVVRMAKMAILACKHDNFLVKNRTAAEVPCSDQHKCHQNCSQMPSFPANVCWLLGSNIMYSLRLII